MSAPIDEETYGKQDRDHDEVKQGNPGKPQSDYESPEIAEDKAPVEDANDRDMLGEGALPD